MENRQEVVFWDIVALFDKYDILQHVVFVGSWAEYIYEHYFESFQSNLKTMDLDILIKNISKPKEPINMTKILTEHGFIHSCDYLTGLTKFSKDGLLELEFLVKEMGRGQLIPYDVKPFGIKAEGLRHLDILTLHKTTLVIRGFKLDIPLPTAYLLHKIIINNKRRSSKREKDKLSISNLLETINKHPTEKAKLSEIYLSLSAKQKRLIQQFVEDNFLDFPIKD